MTGCGFDFDTTRRRQRVAVWRGVSSQWTRARWWQCLRIGQRQFQLLAQHAVLGTDRDGGVMGGAVHGDLVRLDPAQLLQHALGTLRALARAQPCLQVAMQHQGQRFPPTWVKPIVQILSAMQMQWRLTLPLHSDHPERQATRSSSGPHHDLG